MKKSILALTLILAVVLCSCNGDFEVEEKQSGSRELIKVSFYPAESRGLQAVYDDQNLVYLLTATPTFTRTGRTTIVGTVEREEFTPDDKGSFNAGYFERGEWSFVVEAAIKLDDDSYSVIASAEKPNELISEKNTSISFALADTNETDATGDVAVSIKVPRLSGAGNDSSYGAVLTASYGDKSVEFKKPSACSDGDDTDLLLFEGTIEDLDAGCHNIKFTYTVNNTDICSQVVEVRIVKDIVTTVSGTMLNGEYVQGSITVTYVTGNLSLTLKSDATNDTVLKNTDATITCTVANSGGGTVAYDWYVDGSILTTEHNKTSIKFKSSNPGIYCITCVATVGNLSKSESIYIFVNDK